MYVFFSIHVPVYIFSACLQFSTRVMGNIKSLGHLDNCSVENEQKKTIICMSINDQIKFHDCDNPDYEHQCVGWPSEEACYINCR